MRDEALRDLAGMIAPLLDLTSEDVFGQLRVGPWTAASGLDEGEAGQLVAVFRSLGADAELVGPPSRPADEDDVPEAWRAVVAPRPDPTPAPASRLPPPTTGAPTLPVDVQRLAPVAAGTTAPPEAQTRPIDPFQVKAVAEASAPTVRIDPFALSQAEAPAGAATVRVDPLALSQALAEAEASAPTVRVDPAELARALAAREAAPDATTQALELQTTADAPTLRLDGAAVAAGLAAARGRTEALPGDNSPTLSLEVRGQKEDFMRTPGGGIQAVEVGAGTLPFGLQRVELDEDETPTRPFRPPTAIDPMDDDPPPARIASRLAPSIRRPPPEDEAVTGPVPRVGEESFETGAMGSVTAGPLIFRLAPPPVEPTSTGSVPRNVLVEADEAEVGSPAGEVPADAAETTERPVEGRDRPGVYKLRPRSVVLRDRTTAEPTEQMSVPPIDPPSASPAVARTTPTAPPGEVAAAERRAEAAVTGRPMPARLADNRPAQPRPRNTGSIEVMGPDGQRALLAPPARPSRPVEATPRRDHRPGLAATLSLFLPGMGQVYNGERQRGLWFALGALLVFPWAMAVIDAYRTASAIARGERAAPGPGGTAYLSQLAVNCSLFFGIALGLVLWQRTGAPAPPVVDAGGSGVAPAAPAPASAAARPPLGDGLGVSELMEKGRMACGRGLYTECADLMQAILDREPQHRDALDLLVEAKTKSARHP